METDSPLALATPNPKGITFSSEALIASAASMISPQVVGCQSSGRPAFLKTFLLYQIPRESEVPGMAYVLPSSAITPAFKFSV